MLRGLALTCALLVGSGAPAAAWAADAIEWGPVIEMDKQLFPSYIIATATLRLPADEQPEPLPNVLGDPRGMLGVLVTAPSDNAEVFVEISADEIMEPSSITVQLPQQGETYWVYPKIKYKFAALQANKQLTPQNISFLLEVNGELVGDETETVTLRSVNDCVFGISGEDDTPENFTDLKYIFAAYVNEEHPLIDQLLKEALETELVDAFSGYQKNDIGEVYLQVYAIWQALEDRGFRYSDVSTTAAQSARVHSQYVRFLDDSINAAQSNCVDGTVLMASVLRRIGIEPMLVVVPGHCYLAFYLDAEQTTYVGLETTMLNSGHKIDDEAFENVEEIEELIDLVDESWFEELSWRSFNAAVMVGTNNLIEKEEQFAGPDPTYQLIDIRDARRLGIVPIAFRGK